MLQHIAAYLCKVEDEVKVHNLKQIMMPLGMRDKGNQAKQVPGTVRSTQEQVPLSVLLHTAAWFCIDWFVVIERNIYQIFRTRMHLLLLTVVVLFATLARRCSATPMHGKWDVISCQVSEELHCHQAAKIINWSWVEQLSLVILVRIASGGMDYVFDMFRGDDVMRDIRTVMRVRVPYQDQLPGWFSAGSCVWLPAMWGTEGWTCSHASCVIYYTGRGPHLAGGQKQGIA